MALVNQYVNSSHLHSRNILGKNSFSSVDFGKSSGREIICGVAIIASAIYGLIKCKRLIEPAIASMTLVLLTKFISYCHHPAASAELNESERNNQDHHDCRDDGVAQELRQRK